MTNWLNYGMCLWFFFISLVICCDWGGVLSGKEIFNCRQRLLKFLVSSFFMMCCIIICPFSSFTRIEMVLIACIYSCVGVWVSIPLLLHIHILLLSTWSGSTVCCAGDTGTSSVIGVGWTFGGGISMHSSSETESRFISVSTGIVYIFSRLGPYSLSNSSFALVHNYWPMYWFSFPF